MNIKPITLLRGNHAEIGTTGQGCFMNVVAYLNGESPITEKSECVCYIVRPLLVWFNDFLYDEERYLLLPYLLPAIGSRTDYKHEIERRFALMVRFAGKQARYAVQFAQSAKFAAWHAGWAFRYAETAKLDGMHVESAEYDAKSAMESSECAAKYAKSAEYAVVYAAEASLAYDKSAEYGPGSVIKYTKRAIEFAARAASCAGGCPQYYKKTKADFLALLDDYFLGEEQVSHVVEQRWGLLHELANVAP